MALAGIRYETVQIVRRVHLVELGRLKKAGAIINVQSMGKV